MDSGDGGCEVREITVVTEGNSPTVITAKEGCFLKVDDDSMFYLRIVAFRTRKILGMNVVVERQVVASFALSKVVLWSAE